MHTIYIRFYEELNDFLPEEKRKKRFDHRYIDRTSVKDLIESLGVPHTEVDLILVNGTSVGFNHLIHDKEDISVYPVFESFDIKDAQHLRTEPLRKPKFIADIHLGKLTRYLRMLGLDVYYRNDITDIEIVKTSIRENRAILTMDRGLLKRNEIYHAYWIRNSDLEKQVVEVVKRFQLQNQIKEFTRCLECNTPLKMISKENVENRLPQKVKENQDEFCICEVCDKIYWQGTHINRMSSLVERIKNDI
ncbi:MAG: Mut7-C RNAse domain-containing protein [Ignavibacteriaceae bacterium]